MSDSVAQSMLFTNFKTTTHLSGVELKHPKTDATAREDIALLLVRTPQEQMGLLGLMTELVISVTSVVVELGSLEDDQKDAVARYINQWHAAVNILYSGVTQNGQAYADRIRPNMIAALEEAMKYPLPSEESPIGNGSG